MITEKYVSFETAKLLKERGFDEIIFTWYTGNGKFHVGKNTYDDYWMNHFADMAVCKDKNKCSAPTHQEAMDWLRTTHNLHICFRPVIPDKEIEYRAYIFDGNCEPVLSNEFGGTPGYCADMAIRYCLENLIK